MSLTHEYTRCEGLKVSPEWYPLPPGRLCTVFIKPELSVNLEQAWNIYGTEVPSRSEALQHSLCIYAYLLSTILKLIYNTAEEQSYLIQSIKNCPWLFNIPAFSIYECFPEFAVQLGKMLFLLMTLLHQIATIAEYSVSLMLQQLLAQLQITEQHLAVTSLSIILGFGPHTSNILLC